MLLAGYGYAHLISTRFTFRRQLTIHLLLTLCALAFLPVTPQAINWDTGVPVLTLLVVLLGTSGLPFFLVSSTAPLMQRWYAYTGGHSKRDPYFLYAISNAGSMGSLLAYPIIIERFIGLRAQTLLWSVGYVILAVLLLICGVLVWRAHASSPPAAPAHQAATVVNWKQRGLWLLLAFVPSSWMLAVTTRLTTNIAPMPLLWILPLGIYLLTFILVFARHQLIPHRWIQYAFPAVVLVLLGSSVFAGRWNLLALHIGVFFVGAMFCHGTLAARRPPVEHLTDFYLWMSAGGALGGVFNALVAPSLFPLQLEYGIVIAAACGLHALTVTDLQRKPFFLVLCSGVFCVVGMVNTLPVAKSSLAVAAVMLSLPILLTLQLVHWRVAFTAILLAVSSLVEFDAGPTYEVLARARSFYGIHLVVVDRPRIDPENGAPFPRYRRLLHGTTQHGCQSLAADRECEPLLYYHPSGPLGDCFTALAVNSQPTQTIAAIGLGTGAMACYQTPQRNFLFFEIDPVVQQIAKTDFTYLPHCGAGAEVQLGDGRLQLQQMADASCTAIVLDAFSSDAVPTHLLTREAIAMYLQKLQPEGLLIFHVSNRYLDLPAVLSAAATDAGLVARYANSVASSLKEQEAQFRQGIAPATYVVMARRQEHLRDLQSSPRWHSLATSPQRVWTDDYSNIWRVLRLSDK